MTWGSILCNRITWELLPLVLSFRWVSHRISDQLGVIALGDDEDKLVRMDVECWWSWLSFLMLSEVCHLVGVINCRNVLIHVLLYLSVRIQFLWLSEIWEARIHLEMKLNLITSTKLLLQVIAQMRSHYLPILVMRDVVVRILTSNVIFASLTAFSWYLNFLTHVGSFVEGLLWVSRVFPTVLIVLRLDLLVQLFCTDLLHLQQLTILWLNPWVVLLWIAHEALNVVWSNNTSWHTSILHFEVSFECVIILLIWKHFDLSITGSSLV